MKTFLCLDCEDMFIEEVDEPSCLHCDSWNCEQIEDAEDEEFDGHYEGSFND